MVLKKLLGSKWSRRFSLGSVALNGVRALVRGNRRIGALLIGLALLAYRWSPLGIAVTLLYYRYGDRISELARGRPSEQSEPTGS